MIAFLSLAMFSCKDNDIDKDYSERNEDNLTTNSLVGGNWALSYSVFYLESGEIDFEKSYDISKNKNIFKFYPDNTYEETSFEKISKTDSTFHSKTGTWNTESEYLIDTKKFIYEEFSNGNLTLDIVCSYTEDSIYSKTRTYNADGTISKESETCTENTSSKYKLASIKNDTLKIDGYLSNDSSDWLFFKSVYVRTDD